MLASLHKCADGFNEDLSDRMEQVDCLSKRNGGYQHQETHLTQCCPACYSIMKTAETAECDNDAEYRSGVLQLAHIHVRARVSRRIA